MDMSEKKEKINVLFICTGNSCRSQMAQGWARHLKDDVIEAYSAGTMPCVVSSRAAEAMAEAGVDISGHTSKHIDDLAGIEFDYIITLCDSAKHSCPAFPASVKVIHHSFFDPTSLIGTPEQVKSAFRQTRDEIKQFIETLPETLGAEDNE